MDLDDTIPDVRYWSKMLHCSIPTLHLLTDLEIKVTDLEFFMINEMSILHQSIIRKHSSFKYMNLGGYMLWGGAGGQNIEHSHTLVILRFFFFSASKAF